MTHQSRSKPFRPGTGARIIKVDHGRDQERQSGHHGPSLKSSSVILQATGSKYHAMGSGGLSIKSFFGGPAWYSVGSARFKLEENRYLVLNEGQPYEITKDGKRPVESFIVFFQSGLAEDVYRSLHDSCEVLLGEPQHQAQKPPQFYEHTYSFENNVGKAILNLRSKCNSPDVGRHGLDRQLRQLLEQLFSVHANASKDSEVLSALRATTRHELYRRLHIAREFIVATCDQPFSLSRVADAACMSRNHLIRTFNQLFDQTPHQLHDQLRLERAKSLLASGNYSVMETCTQVGFRSLGTFSSRFRKLTGSSPSIFAALKR